MKTIIIKDVEKKEEFEILESVYNDHYKDSERYEVVKKTKK